MADVNVVTHLSEAIKLRAEPAITRWNRIEGRPRTHHFDRALRAEVRDPLWFLTRQWQMGEFQGDDAGSPVLARICSSTTTIDQYQAGRAAVEPFSLELPLETTVERRPLRWRAGTQKLALDLRLVLGRRWHKLLDRDRARGLLTADFWTQFRTRYRVDLPDPHAKEDAAVCAHAEAWRQFSAAASRAMDGYALFEYLDEDPTHRASDGVGAAGTDVARLDALAVELRAWLADLLEEPPVAGDAAWQPRKLEYQFGCSAPLGGSDLVLRATEYSQGRLDWYALERVAARALGDQSGPGAAPPIEARTFIPTAPQFSGMPATRWWAFEDQRTNLGEVRPDTVDLGKLFLLEFALVYANDWFSFPLTLPIGTVTTVKGIAVTNVFNERIWVEPVSRQPVPAAQIWDLFQVTRPKETEPTLVLLPVAAKVLEGAPLEEVAFVRDEMANMVWGVERRIPLPTGSGKPGAESGLELLRQMERIVGAPPDPPDPKAPIRYQVMNTVPEHWIPFLPVHIDGSSRETQLQRGAMPRILGNDPSLFEPIRPRTSLLREGLDLTSGAPSRRYYIDEEEVPRAGAVVTQSYQRTRWLDGRAVVWLGAAKATGRGEGNSGLAFDLIAIAKEKKP